jgi:hypothetical protein
MTASGVQYNICYNLLQYLLLDIKPSVVLTASFIFMTRTWLINMAGMPTVRRRERKPPQSAIEIEECEEAGVLSSAPSPINPL